MDKHTIVSHNSSLSKSQRKILLGAQHCFQQWGIDKTSMHDLARQAGVTRQTVYSYYSDKEAVANAALLHSAYELATKLFDVIEGQKNTHDRLLAALVMTVEELSNEPYYSLLVSNQKPGLLENALLSEEGLQMSAALLKDIVRDARISDVRVQEIIDYCMRMILALVIFKTPKPLKGAELGDYLERYLITSEGVRDLCRNKDASR